MPLDRSISQPIKAGSAFDPQDQEDVVDRHFLHADVAELIGAETEKRDLALLDRVERLPIQVGAGHVGAGFGHVAFDHGRQHALLERMGQIVEAAASDEADRDAQGDGETQEVLRLEGQAAIDEEARRPPR